MIGWLKGTIKDKQPPMLLLAVNDVGYEIQAPMTTFYQLPESGSVELFTHLVVREDAHLLYGFASVEERHLFRTLIKVNGVGPKLALAILSSIDVEQFVACVQQDDVNALVKIPGIGKKTAERLLIEMRDKLKDWTVQILDEVGGNTLQAIQPKTSEEAESALIALGYKPQEASKMIAHALRENEGDASSEALIKAALKAQAR